MNGLCNKMLTLTQQVVIAGGFCLRIFWLSLRTEFHMFTFPAAPFLTAAEDECSSCRDHLPGPVYDAAKRHEHGAGTAGTALSKICVIFVCTATAAKF